ncbi:MAG TPA: hypothetical protein ENH99_01385 [Candidatus Pacearchaeota archaeon]|nr:hypothetical protein [Candidatus Pacearchaeota archaeon]
MKTKELVHELKHHLPLTVFATAIALVVVLVVGYSLKQNLSETFFDVLHPLHIFASAIVASGIFYKYKPKVLGALSVGIIGAILIGSLSDVLLPWLGGNLLNLETIFHLPLIESPYLILFSAIFGSAVGIGTKITKVPHFVHVFLSVFASLFYLIAFSTGMTLLPFLIAFFIIIIAVVVPCCVGDIVLPFFFLGKKIKTCECK